MAWKSSTSSANKKMWSDAKPSMRSSLKSNVLKRDLNGQRTRKNELSNNLIIKRSLLSLYPQFHSKDKNSGRLPKSQATGRDEGMSLASRGSAEFKVVARRKANTSLARTTKLYMSGSVGNPWEAFAYEFPAGKCEECPLFTNAEIENALRKRHNTNNLVQDALDLNIQNTAVPLQISTILFRKRKASHLKTSSITEHPKRVYKGKASLDATPSSPKKEPRNQCPIIIKKASILPVKAAPKKGYSCILKKAQIIRPFTSKNN